MTSLGEYIYRGMGAAVALFLIVYGVLLIAEAGEKAGRKGAHPRGRAQTYANQPYGHAQAMGKHVRKGL